MSDMMSIGANAVTAYQQALSTVSNNIANANTEGYSTETTNIQQTAPAQMPGYYIGMGASVENIQRAYDSFAASNLRASTSELQSQSPMVNYAQSIVNVMGDPTAGLTTSLSGYFNSAQSLSANPGSTNERNSFLTSANTLASQFSEVSGQLTSIGKQAQQQLVSSVQQVNTITSQLALVNGQLSASSSLNAQAPQLLDQRDLLLQQLASLTHITSSFTANGTVTVSMSNTASQNIVVNGQKSSPIGIDPNNPNGQNLVLEPYGNTQSLTGSSGGVIGGIQTFMSQVLQPAQESFNELAKTFVSEANSIQMGGIDGNGNKGLALFNLNPSNPNAAEAITVNLSNPMQIATGAQFAATQGSTNVSSTNANVNYQDPGAPVKAIGNTALVNTVNSVYDTNIPIDPNQGSALVTSVAAGVNSPTIYLDNAQPGQNLQVITTDGRQLIGTPLSANQQAQIITPANGFNTPLTYSTQYLNQSGNNGYLGLNVFYGAKADVQYQQAVDSSGVATLNPVPIPATITSGRITNLGSTVNPVIEAGAVQLDGVALGALTPSAGGLTAADVQNWINNVPNSIDVPSSSLNFNNSLTINGQQITGYSDIKTLAFAINSSSSSTNVTASIASSGDLVLQATTPAATQPIQIGSSGGSANNALGIANNTYPYAPKSVVPNVSASIYNEITIPANSLNFSKTLSINGTSITGFFDLPSLVNAIQKQSTLTNVTATTDPAGQLILQANSNAAGLPIQIGTTDLSNTNALEIGNGTYNPMISISQSTVTDSSAPNVAASFASASATLGNTSAFNLNVSINNSPSVLLQIAQTPATVQNVIDSINSSISQNSFLSGYTASFNTDTGKIDFKNSTGTQVSTSLSSYVNYPNLNGIFANQTSILNNHVAFNISLAVGNSTPQEVSIPPNASTDDVINAINNVISAPGSALQGDKASVVNIGTTSSPAYQIQITSSTGKTLTSNINLYQPSLELSFGANGQPADLSKIGIRSGAYISGQVPSNLLVFATGSGGAAQVGATYSGAPIDPATQLQTQKLNIEIKSNGQYAITDVRTGTELAVGTYNTNVSQPSINYQGLTVLLNQQPSVGDSFSVSENKNAVGDNTNILQMVALGTKQTVGQNSFADAYTNQTNTVGNQAQQALMSQQALTVVNTQAKNAQDKVSGVNMNNEAANLIRFQQAYQAAAKTIQIATQNFSTIERITSG